MILSDHIARLIEEMLEEGNGQAEVRRNDLAARIGCVPSQINYVITSRFTPERGYVTESRRGGGGYIRIVRVPMTKNSYLMHFFHAIGETLEEAEAKAYLKNLADAGIITAREANLAAVSLSQKALDKVPPEIRPAVRADILRHILMMLML
ncbi:MAG: CtsR family transcriptional regulator [Clostridia bacterium]|nr:CtsR family transcriptional regulator [Clostridia bacterium]